MDPDTEELLTFDLILNSVVVKLVQLAPFPEAQVQFYVRTALFSGELIQATGDLYYRVNSGAVTSLLKLRGKAVGGWCDDKNNIPSLGLATPVTWTFDQRPYARAKGDQWTADAVFYRKYGGPAFTSTRRGLP